MKEQPKGINYGGKAWEQFLFKRTEVLERRKKRRKADRFIGLGTRKNFGVAYKGSKKEWNCFLLCRGGSTKKVRRRQKEQRG